MRSRVFIGLLLVVGVFAVATVAAMAPMREWAIVDFSKPTVIAGAIVMGPVLIVHDDAKMETGEACTTVYRFDPTKGPQEKIVSFVCKPVERPVAKNFTTTCKLLNFGSDLVVLNEYQFAGDTEAHGVPSPQ